MKLSPRISPLGHHLLVTRLITDRDGERTAAEESTIGDLRLNGSVYAVGGLIIIPTTSLVMTNNDGPSTCGLLSALPIIYYNQFLR